ncbi:MAG TPA: AraC family transcriptional regulator, partial [Pseudoalteromonas sp.]|nr:AraC family transcriptional regulator [Pseudoalteromonas sp.]
NQLLQGHAISQVCFDVGFNSASHFSRVFKQTFGIAPKECRH